MAKHPIYTMSFAKSIPRIMWPRRRKRGVPRREVDEIIRWLTGPQPGRTASTWKSRLITETFFAGAPQLNPARALIKGVVCGVRVEEIEEPFMREFRYLDKLIDELAKGKKGYEKILVQAEGNR